MRGIRGSAAMTKIETFEHDGVFTFSLLQALPTENVCDSTAPMAWPHCSWTTERAPDVSRKRLPFGEGEDSSAGFQTMATGGPDQLAGGGGSATAPMRRYFSYRRASSSATGNSSSWLR